MISKGESPDVKVKRSVVSNVGEIVGDAATLAELQFQLLQVDAKESIRHLIFPTAVTTVGLLLAAGCFPVALIVIASLLHELADLPMYASGGIALLIGAVTAAAMIVVGMLGLKRAVKYFDRTISELKRNIAWLKQLKGGLGADQPESAGQRNSLN